MFDNAILIKLTLSEPFLYLQTYDKLHGSSHHFLINTEGLLRLLSEESNTLVESDLYSFVRIVRTEQTLHFHVCWLNLLGRNDLKGYMQIFSVPVDTLIDAFAEKKAKHLYYDHSPKEKARIEFSPKCHKAIGQMRGDKLQIRAFIKFLRDHFAYGRNETITVYPDSWVNGFYFSSSDKYDGGIVPMNTTVRGSDLQAHFCLRYGLHT